jgi:hypothetical protein
MEKTNVHLAGSQECAPAAQRSSGDEAERLALMKFYGVQTLEELVDRTADDIKRPSGPAELAMVLRACADDPMWANHCEVSKFTARASASAIDTLAGQRDALLEALRFYATSCDATETTPCGYEGNLCCKTARDAIKASEGKAA